MRHTGANMGSVKKQNRSAILKYINEAGEVSRKDIAAATGLTPAAVTLICNEFLEQGLLAETGAQEETQGAGRRKIPLAINYDYCYILAVTLEPEETVIALSNMRGRLIDRCSRRTEGGIAPELFLGRVAQDCRMLLQANPGEAAKTAGVSVAVSGLVDVQQGSSVRAYGIWEQEVPVCTILERELKLPVLIENNVNAFAKAELAYGVGKNYDNLLVIKWGPGVGSTIIIDRNVYEGRHGKAAEVGHYIVEKGGIRCSCGRRGCLETRVSYHALQQQEHFPPEAFGEVYRRAQAEGRSRIYDEAMDLFARMIVNTVTVLAPNRVVLCGKLFASELVRQRMTSCCMAYDEKLNADRIIYTELAAEEDYIGPVAAYVQSEIFG